jgi:hypothetical protein
MPPEDEPLSQILRTVHHPLDMHPIIKDDQLAAWAARAAGMESEIAALRQQVSELPATLNRCLEDMSGKRLDIARHHHTTFAHVRDEMVKVFGEGVEAGLEHWEDATFHLKHKLEQELEISLNY